MIDIHTHILFDVDDGSATFNESVALLKKAVEVGVTDIIVTPHYIDSGEYNKEKVDIAFNKLKDEIKVMELPLRIYLGNEIMVYGDVEHILDDENISTLANSKYILIEFPMNNDVSFVPDVVTKLKEKGLVPIIAHPERCECFKKHSELIDEVLSLGAYLQCNTGSILGKYGMTAKRIFKKLLKENKIMFISTDVHNLKNNRYNDLLSVEQEVQNIVGLYEKNKLFKYNARKILINE